MFQEDGVQGEGNGENEERENEKGRSPSPERDDILEKRNEEERADAHAYACKPIGSPSFSFKPVGEDDRERSNTEARDPYSSHHTVEEIELGERFDLCAEKES
jgi:hypothetical protein